MMNFYVVRDEKEGNIIFDCLKTAVKYVEYLFSPS